eukprot:CAMPEP_0175232616 /NCGR_PEP_ID=MMETSP0093-20121207/26053_1 /TAXON_ID=311494 /ORGANISM="Alexandrium monilatum, Strain CCMP3105" /LENGTH=91 /DNA_ID=CAMNT_0016526483 /DNA_START=30 /DNA_END=305 /DNA_ORIENTATION=+
MTADQSPCNPIEKGHTRSALHRGQLQMPAWTKGDKKPRQRREQGHAQTNRKQDKDGIHNCPACSTGRHEPPPTEEWVQHACAHASTRQQIQ